MTRRTIQLGFVWLIAAIAVISGPRLVLYEFSTQGNIPLEFNVAALSLPDYAMTFFIAISLLRWINVPEYAQRVNDYIRQMIKRGGWIWGALVALMFLSVLWADTPLMAAYTAIHLLACVVMMIFIIEIAQKHLNSLLLILVLMGVLQAVLALLQAVNNGPFGLNWLGEQNRLFYEPLNYFRARGLSMHPNYLGGYLMLCLFAGGVLLPQYWTHASYRYSLIVAMILLALGMAATLSRSALLSTGIGLLPLMIYGLSTQPPPRRRLIMLGLGGLGGAGMFAVFLFLGGNLSNIQERIFSSREFFFDDTWTLIQEAPVQGIGAGNIMLEVGEDKPLLEVSGDLLPVHNVYLYVWAEIGIIGMGLFILGCVVVLWQFWRLPRNWMTLTWGGVWLACCAVMLFDNYFWAVHPVRVTFFYILGITWGVIVMKTAESPGEQPE
jgi:O-antigen ligase